MYVRVRFIGVQNHSVPVLERKLFPSEVFDGCE
jgi:hypothetical protein